MKRNLFEIFNMSKSIDISQSFTYPKWFGGSASCMAVLVSHPLDLSEFRYSIRKNIVLIDRS